MSRAEEAARRVELAAAAERAESAKAQVLIDAFVLDARARGIAPESLRVTLHSGHSARSDKVGWYLRQNKNLAIGDDGSYYVLTVPGGWKERLTGVELTASPPPLIVGKGGRDGESGDLVEFLQRRLDAG